MPVRMIEWHCGIGGVSAALKSRVHAVAAVDNNREAIEIYARNFPQHQATVKNIESISAREIMSWGHSDFWWMSPPCQPHTRLGNMLDTADPRSASFLRMLGLIRQFKPENLAMENVPGFATSHSRELMIQTLDSLGYVWAEELVCPTAWNWPNRRNRYYLAATRDHVTGLQDPESCDDASHSHIFQHVSKEADLDQNLHLSVEFMARYQHAIHVADRDDVSTVTNCFTSAYGRSPTRCGSYLKFERENRPGVRRFSPREILSLLDFPEDYELPYDLPPRKLWPMVGNSLSLGATRRVIARLPIWRSL